MPCPPTWEELEQDRLDRLLPPLREAFAKLVPHHALVRPVALLLQARKAFDDPERELTNAWKASEKFATAPVFPGPRAVDSTTHEGLERLGKEEQWLGLTVRELELTACTLGCAITRWTNDHGTPKDVAGLEQALAAHRAHREEDRAARLVQLDQQIRRAKKADQPALRALRRRVKALKAPRLYEERGCLFTP